MGPLGMPSSGMASGTSTVAFRPDRACPRWVMASEKARHSSTDIRVVRSRMKSSQNSRTGPLTL